MLGADNQQERSEIYSDILRDYTPGTLSKIKVKIESELHGDMQRLTEMISPSIQIDSNNLSEIPCRVSSDLHEWRNDGHAVSIQGSVKLKSL